MFILLHSKNLFSQIHCQLTQQQTHTSWHTAKHVLGMNTQNTVIFQATLYEDVSKSFWTGCLEWELQMVQPSATKYNFIAILCVSLVSFAIINFCVASQ
jgi:hypothetical protein